MNQKLTFESKLRRWVLSHKIAASFIGIFAIVVLLIIIWLIISLPARKSYMEQPGLATESIRGETRNYESAEVRLNRAERPSEIKVREGDISIKSKDAEGSEGEIRLLTQEYEGYIEESRKKETNTHLRIFIKSRIPIDKFDNFFEELRNTFEVKNYNLKDYRISIERELDELEILESSIDEYRLIREEIRKMEVGQEKMSLLMQITENKLKLARKEAQFSRDASLARQRGEFATISMSLEQRLPPSFIPEDFGVNFINNISQAFRNIINHLTDIITVGIELFFIIVKHIVYALIIIIPLWVTVGILFKLFKKKK